MHASIHLMQRDTKRFWVGVEWGAIATLAMTIVMLLVYLINPRGMPDPMPLAITTGIIARVFELERITPWVVALGIVIQLGYGSIWGGQLAWSTHNATIGKGIAVGLGLWLMMLIFYVPMAGTTAFSLAESGLMWLMTLFFHLIYGVTLGAGLHRHPEPFIEQGAE